jgi:hypothetical protein
MLRTVMMAYRRTIYRVAGLCVLAALAPGEDAVRRAETAVTLHQIDRDALAVKSTIGPSRLA